MEYGNMEIEIPEVTLLLERIPSYSTSWSIKWEK